MRSIYKMYRQNVHAESSHMWRMLLRCCLDLTTIYQIQQRKLWAILPLYYFRCVCGYRTQKKRLRVLYMMLFIKCYCACSSQIEHHAISCIVYRVYVYTHTQLISCCCCCVCVSVSVSTCLRTTYVRTYAHLFALLQKCVLQLQSQATNYTSVCTC